ncbi:receptor-type tyrosine-protein phosphatase H [Mugil cephalus]|uniref:receptor-type tyrosine-protein phosphatase H n=1 Tax=Mugil cephalus TaxID=48193 RepID=UPI001FB5FA2D|nr:receptor-type tyrosine-protein phosphatase H [Mugil cephalus]
MTLSFSPLTPPPEPSDRALMLTYGSAERQYFIQSKNLTWDEARKNCQMCFKDLVTVTPENTQIFARRINYEHWIGLRKNFDPKSNSTSISTSTPTSYPARTPTSNYTSTPTSNYTSTTTSYPTSTPTSYPASTTTSNYTSTPTSYSMSYFTSYDISDSTSNSTSKPSMPWTRWANGDPLAFQNWYPGWPVFKSSFPRRDCCSCSCTCPAPEASSTTSVVMSLTRTTESTTQSMTTSTRQYTTDNTTDTTNFTGQIVTNSTGQNTTDITNSTDQSMTNSIGQYTIDSTTDTTIQYTIDSTTDTTNFTGQIETNSTGQYNTYNSNSTRVNTTESMTSTTKGFATDGPTASTDTRKAATSLPLEATCSRSPMPMPDVPDPDENYIEDSCVAMLSFGAWVEKECFELLPFICYEDRFFGQVNVTNITTKNATLTWDLGPGDISHYRVEVNGDIQLESNLTNTTLDLANLTAGTNYSVQVFPVKCERDLNPQNASFYTTPNEVRNLRVTGVKERSIVLSWDRPDGNLEFYLVKVEAREMRAYSETQEVDGLTPGSFYKFIVLSGVKDESTWSEESFVTAYTRPEKVSLLNFSRSNDSVHFTWEKPEGNYTGFRVTVYKDKELRTPLANLSQVVEGPPWRVLETKLPKGAEVTLAVTALANHTLEGDPVSMSFYTAPGPVSDLTVKTTEDTVRATWSLPLTDFKSYIVELYLDDVIQNTSTIMDNTANTTCFEKLKIAANYTVLVYAVSGDLLSQSVGASNFTLPRPPTNAVATDRNHSSITFTWKAPENASPNITYLVTLNSIFWNYTHKDSVYGSTRYVFSNLISGTTYDFEVRTEAGNVMSNPAKARNETARDERLLSLSMLCTSETPLLCSNSTTWESIRKQLEDHFFKELGRSVFWELK